MTLNLQSILMIIGAIIVLFIYLFSKWQNRTRPPSKKSARPGIQDPRRNAFPGRLDRRFEPELDLPAGRPGENREIDSVTGPPDFDGPDFDGPDFGSPDLGGLPAHRAVARTETSRETSVKTPVAADDNTHAAAPADIAADDNTHAAAPADIAADDNTHAAAPAAAAADVRPGTGRKNPPDGNFAGASRAPEFGPSAGGYQRRAIDGFERLGQIDYWVKITGERDVGRETVLAIYRDGATGFTKSHGIHGLKEAEKEWCNLEDEAEDSRFGNLVATIQLADRAGPISAPEMARFSDLVLRLSEGTGREFAFMTTIENAFAQAAAIAEFSRCCGTTFAVNIRPQNSAPFPGTEIDRCATSMGLERGENHYYSRFKLVGKDKVALYSLANMREDGRFDFDDMKAFSARGLVFLTQPAVNRLPGAVFAEMVDTARGFASRIGGVVESPHHDDLSQAEVDATRRAIEQAAAEMEQLGIPAGSEAAARIF